METFFKNQNNKCNEFSTSKCALLSDEGGISEADLGYEQICQCNRCYVCPPLRSKDCAEGNKSWFHPYSCGAYDEASKLCSLKSLSLKQDG